MTATPNLTGKTCVVTGASNGIGKVTAAALASILAASAPAHAQDVPSATAQHGAFAFPDEAGTRLIAVSDPPDPSSLRIALCTGGRRFAVRFDHRQAERSNDGRQTPRNFDLLAGSVFTVLDARVAATATCFLAAAALLESATVLAPAPPPTAAACTSADRRLASSRGRAVVHCWPIAHLGENRRIVLVEFARRGADALASLVLLDRDRAVFEDYPATFSRRDEDLWRVDDGGVLTPEGFEIVFVLRRGTSYTIGVNWSGTENASLAVLVSGEGSRFTPVISDSWYQSPI